MTRVLAAVIVACLAFPAPAAAHRLDEYLQATRVSLERRGVHLEVDLTPGVAIADQLLRLVDVDGNGSLSPDELRAYGERVMADVTLNVDGRTLSLRLMRAEASTIGELRAGLGAIRLQAATDIAPVAPGARTLHVRNLHEPMPSVYLANALLPTDAAVTVVRQERDVRQQEIRVDYDVAANPRGERLIWLVVGPVALVLLVGLRRRLDARVPEAFA